MPAAPESAVELMDPQLATVLSMFHTELDGLEFVGM